MLFRSVWVGGGGGFGEVMREGYVCLHFVDKPSLITDCTWFMELDSNVKV